MKIMRQVIGSALLLLLLLLAMTSFCDPLINIGTNVVKVVYENAMPTNSISICQDLPRLFSFARSLDDVFPDGTSPGVHRLRGKDPFMYPDSAKTGLALVTSATNQYIQISSELQNAFDAAFLLTSSNSVPISQLDCFIAALNSLTHTNVVIDALVGILENPPEVPNPTTAQFIADATFFCQMLEAYKYYHPSVLSIKPDNGTIQAIVVTKERGNESNVDVVEIKYVIDGWKLVFPK